MSVRGNRRRVRLLDLGAAHQIDDKQDDQDQHDDPWDHDRGTEHPCSPFCPGQRGLRYVMINNNATDALPGPRPRPDRSCRICYLSRPRVR
jgi:hypothetical protein